MGEPSPDATSNPAKPDRNLALELVRVTEAAALAAARWVGRTLSQLPSDSKLPWHRVLGANGRISLPVGSPSGDEQRARLRMEGISILNNRVDIQRHGWRPVEHSG